MSITHDDHDRLVSDVSGRIASGGGSGGVGSFSRMRSVHRDLMRGDRHYRQQETGALDFDHERHTRTCPSCLGHREMYGKPCRKCGGDGTVHK